MSRLLKLALGMGGAQNGFLLVDEIDTGLHYSVMRDMWRMVVETARELNVQVFATTHSSDCVSAIAALISSQPELKDDISVHRIEAGREKTVVFTSDEIITAVQHNIEVR